jgi:hypothetical protein
LQVSEPYGVYIPSPFLTLTLHLGQGLGGILSLEHDSAKQKYFVVLSLIPIYPYVCITSTYFRIVSRVLRYICTSMYFGSGMLGLGGIGILGEMGLMCLIFIRMT